MGRGGVGGARAQAGRDQPSGGSTPCTRPLRWIMLCTCSTTGPVSAYSRALHRANCNLCGSQLVQGYGAEVLEAQKVSN